VLLVKELVVYVIYTVCFIGSAINCAVVTSAVAEERENAKRTLDVPLSALKPFKGIEVPSHKI